LAANGGAAVGAEMPLGEIDYLEDGSAPVEATAPWGGVVAWAAKLFSIRRM